MQILQMIHRDYKKFLRLLLYRILQKPFQYFPHLCHMINYQCKVFYLFPCDILLLCRFCFLIHSCHVCHLVFYLYFLYHYNHAFQNLFLYLLLVHSLFFHFYRDNCSKASSRRNHKVLEFQHSILFLQKFNHLVNLSHSELFQNLNIQRKLFLWIGHLDKLFYIWLLNQFIQNAF